MLCFCYVAFRLLDIVMTICLFDNVEKLSMLLGFSRDIVEGWARVCCVHVFLVRVCMSYHSAFVGITALWEKTTNIEKCSLITTNNEH